MNLYDKDVLLQVPQDEQGLHVWLTHFVFVLGTLTYLGTNLINAPYGRFVRKGWGPTIPARLGWIIMESPSAIWFAFIFLSGEHKGEWTALIGASLWLTHYVYRSYIYPFLLRGYSEKRMPLSIALLAIFYNTINAYINARYLSHFGEYNTDEPFKRPTFYIGAALFALGFLYNIHSDQVLIHLRKPGEKGYKIPHGGLFEYITAPNYFCEIIEWTGWAIMTMSLPGLSFAFYTFTNLGPRAFNNHHWYQEKFKDEYPKERKALIPFVW